MWRVAPVQPDKRLSWGDFSNEDGRNWGKLSRRVKGAPLILIKYGAGGWELRGLMALKDLQGVLPLTIEKRGVQGQVCRSEEVPGNQGSCYLH